MPTALRSVDPAPRALGAAAALLACLAAGPAAAQPAVVLGTDFATGYYSTLALQPPYARQTNIGPTCADAVVRVQQGMVYVIGRFGCDHVQVIDPSAGFATVRQWSTGNGTNPQDIVVVGPGKAYVSLYERNYLLVVDPATGTQRGTISLAGFADADGLPEAASMQRVGNRVFVALQRLDRPQGFVAANPSYLAVVDADTDQLVDADAAAPGVQAIALTRRNPFDLGWDPVRQRLVVAEVGNFGPLDGGIEFVDPVALRAEGLVATEAQLGGDLNAARLWSDCTGYAIVNDASYRTRLVRFSWCTGGVLGTVWQSAGFDLCDIEIDGHDQVLLADRDLVAPGVRVFRARDAQPLAGPLGFGLPPCDMALLVAPALAETPPAAAAAIRLLPNWPDPFNPATTLAIEAPPGTPASVDVLDARGRRVRRLWAGLAGGGRTGIVWDGRDDGGRALPSGVYMARLRAADATRSERLVLLR